MPVDENKLNAYVTDPSDHFSDPREVLEHPDLSLDDKRKILESWRIDEIELSTATSENMGKGESNMLSRVSRALQELID